MTLLLPFFAILAWMALPVAAWRLGRRWVRLAPKWKWAVRFLTVAVVLTAIGATLLVPGEVSVHMASGDAYVVMNHGWQILPLASIYLLLGGIHLALAAKDWHVVAMLAAMQFWLWHLGQFSTLARPALVRALMPQRYVDYEGAMGWLSGFTFLSALATWASGIFLILLLAVALFRHLRAPGPKPPHAL